LIVGEECAGVARSLGLPVGTVATHKRNHLPRLLARAEAARELANAGYLLARIKELVDDLDRIRRGARAKADRPLRIKAIEALAARFEFLLKVGAELAAAGRREEPMTEEEFNRMVEAHLATHPEVIERYVTEHRPRLEAKNG
jgi:hypothetical protein